MTHLHAPNFTLAAALAVLSPFDNLAACVCWEHDNAFRLVRQRMVANVHAPRLLLEGCL